MLKTLTLIAVTVLFLTLSRTIITPIGLIILLAIVFGSMLFSLTKLMLTVLTRKFQDATIVSLILSIVLMTITTYRSSFLGMDIFYIPTISMVPTLKVNDLVICDTWKTRNLVKGDVILFSHPVHSEKTYIKRITKIDNRPNGEKSFFVTGDNIKHSEDSRHFGNISQTAIQCKGTWAISLGMIISDWEFRPL